MHRYRVFIYMCMSTLNAIYILYKVYWHVHFVFWYNLPTFPTIQIDSISNSIVRWAHHVSVRRLYRRPFPSLLPPWAPLLVPIMESIGKNNSRVFVTHGSYGSREHGSGTYINTCSVDSEQMRIYSIRRIAT